MTLVQKGDVGRDPKSHTPGPWSVYDKNDAMHLKIKGHYPGTGGAHVATILGWGNARLIVAAPLLLEALEEIEGQAVCEPIASNEEVREMLANCARIARAAIAASSQTGGGQP